MSGTARVLREDGTVEAVGECEVDACASPHGCTSSNVFSLPGSDSIEVRRLPRAERKVTRNIARMLDPVQDLEIGQWRIPWIARIVQF